MASMFCYKLTLAAVLMTLLYSEGTLAQTTNHVTNLLSGLRAHKKVLFRVLLPFSSLPTTVHAEEQFEHLLNDLVELSELDEELDGLALELQDSLELAATRAVLKGVLQESCNWLSLKIPDFDCTRAELKRLRAVLDSLSLSVETYAGIRRNTNGIGAINDFQWTQDNIRCGATEEVREILNTAFARELDGDSFTLDGC